MAPTPKMHLISREQKCSPDKIIHKPAPARVPSDSCVRDARPTHAATIHFSPSGRRVLSELCRLRLEEHNIFQELAAIPYPNRIKPKLEDPSRLSLIQPGPLGFEQSQKERMRPKRSTCLFLWSQGVGMEGDQRTSLTRIGAKLDVVASFCHSLARVSCAKEAPAGTGCRVYGLFGSLEMSRLSVAAAWNTP